MYTCVYIYIYVCIYTHVCLHVIRIWKRTHVRIHTHTHTPIHTHMHTRVHKHIHALIHAGTHTHTHTYNTCSYTSTHSFTHSYTHKELGQTSVMRCARQEQSLTHISTGFVCSAARPRFVCQAGGWAKSLLIQGAGSSERLFWSGLLTTCWGNAWHPKLDVLSIDLRSEISVRHVEIP